VLATITDYVAGETILTNDGIDNRTDRRILPSTQTLHHVIECMLQQNMGGDGPPGPGIDAVNATIVDCEESGSASIQSINNQRTLVLEIPRGCNGPVGPQGPGIDEVDATIVDCEKDGSAAIQTVNNRSTLILEIPRGCNGKNGLGIDDVALEIISCDEQESAAIKNIEGKRTLLLKIPSRCDKDLTHICGINWTHGATHTEAQARKKFANGLLIAFDSEVRNIDIHSQSVLFLRRHEDVKNKVNCWCEVPATISGANLDNNKCKIDFENIKILKNGTDVAVNSALITVKDLGPGDYRVAVKGDFIRNWKNGKALDADHLPDWLPNSPTGDGIEGGLFESWFTIGNGK
jgi:hypothetical protein